MFAIDLGLAVLAIAATPWLKGPDWNATLPGFWVMAPLLAWAVHWRWRGGLAASTVLSLTDVVVRTDFDQANYGNVFLLMIGGPIVGYMCGSLQRMAVERERAEHAAAAAEERTRLARAVHDGVLQVLALVQRHGSASLDEQTAELARLAGVQERRLRSLIRQQDTSVVSASLVDLAGLLEETGADHGNRVEVVTPGTPVLVPSSTATELAAAVGACLDNVTSHVGPSAPAWVLLESLADRVVVTVRDSGPGIAPGRLAEAEEEGRLGVASSIRGRLADLGGEATLATGTWGTEWALSVPNGDQP